MESMVMGTYRSMITNLFGPALNDIELNDV